MMKHRIIGTSEIFSAAKTIGKGVKKSSLLSGAWDGKYAVAVVVVDGVKPKAEVHEHAVDVWRVEKGTGKFILGGKLISPEKIRDGEYVADEIDGGETVDIKEGDVIDVPAGVPQKRVGYRRLL